MKNENIIVFAIIMLIVILISTFLVCLSASAIPEPSMIEKRNPTENYPVLELGEQPMIIINLPVELGKLGRILMTISEEYPNATVKNQGNKVQVFV